MDTNTNTNNVNVSNVAMLHRLRVCQWYASQKDQDESRKVCEQNNAEDGAASVFVQLVPKEELKAIQKARSKVRSIWLRYTLPWLDDGVRILPVGCYERFTAEISDAVNGFNAAVEEFLERYPKIIEKAAPTLGDLLKNNPLPSVGVLRNRFSVQQDIQPLPKADDFTVDRFTNGELSMIRRNITNAVNRATTTATGTLYNQLADLLTRIRDTTAEKDKIFRDSLIENLKSFCTLLPDLNIMQDARLNELCRECSNRLASIKPQDLRDNPTLRSKTSKAAKAMLEKVRAIDLNME